MSHDMVWDVLIATTGLTIVLWLGSGLARRSSAALRHMLGRMALAGFWLVPAILVAANVLKLEIYAVQVPVLPPVAIRQPMRPAATLRWYAAAIQTMPAARIHALRPADTTTPAANTPLCSVAAATSQRPATRHLATIRQFQEADPT